MNKLIKFAIAVKTAASDMLWVGQALIRGKVLRQRAYRPITFGDNNKIHTFNLPVAVNGKRLSMLLRCWGCRPMNLEELMKFAEQSMPETKYERVVPYLNWDGNQWHWSTRPFGNWNNNCHFISHIKH